ncbi:MAG: beta-ketoacyl-[acyl-carrier-protein] synthase family protein [Acidobacteriota bacterium]
MTPGPRAVVTGIGLVTPLGLSAAETWAGSRKGKSAISAMRRFDVTGHECVSSAEVPDFDLAPSLRFPKSLKFMTKSVLCGVRAAKEAVAGSGLDLAELDPYRIGIYAGSGETGIESSVFFKALNFAWEKADGGDLKHLGGRASRLIDPYFSIRTLSNAGVSFLSSEFGARGPNQNFVQSDSASALAVSAAYHDLIEERCDVAITGGYDSLLTVSAYLAYERMGLLSGAPPKEAFRPFDRRRDGLVLGEGAAFFVLERHRDALRRNAPIWGEILGVGCSQDVADARQPKSSESNVRSAIAEVIGDGNIDFLIAHGLGTGEGDRREVEILQSIFGSEIPVTALKSQTGYLGAATAAVELGVGLLSARERLIPPIARLHQPDVDFSLDFVRKPRRLSSPTPRFLCLAWSWGGQFAALLGGACRQGESAEESFRNPARRSPPGSE